MKHRLRQLPFLALGAILALTACEAPTSIAVTTAAGAPPAAVAASTTSTTAPDPCADYDALERGEGSPERQAWMNGLDARGYARFRSACVYRWGTAEWQCLDSIWTGESGWDHRLANGIPQAMPAGKMANAPGGPDWRTNPRTQVRWGLDYIAKRYGAPSRAGTQPPFSRDRCDAGY